MSTGFGGGGGYSLYRLQQYPSSEIRSLVQVLLPFGIPGLNGSYEVQTPRGLWNVSANMRRIPPKAIEPHLEGYEFTVDENGLVTEVRAPKRGVQRPRERSIISLVPDRWGRSWRTELYMSLGGVLHPGDDQKLGIEEMSTNILIPCCVCINRILDAIAYIGGPSWLPLVTPQDFWFVRVDYLHESKQVGYFEALGRQMFWWEAPRPFNEATQLSLRRLLKSEAFLPLDEELIVTAVRKLEQGDNRGAIIDSICAVESVLGPFLEKALKARGVSQAKISSVVGPAGLGLADQIYVLLPLLQPQQLSEALRKDFADANAKRNKIVHRGEGATQTEAKKHLATCRKVIEHLTTAPASKVTED